MTSPRCSAPPPPSSAGPPRWRARPRWRRAFCSGSPPSPAKRDGSRRWGAASIISPWRASSTARTASCLASRDPVDMAPSAADRGSAIHAAVGRFSQTFADALPPDAHAQLLAIGRAEFQALDDHPEARALWWPRFERIARWLIGWEEARRPDLGAMQAEIRGEITYALCERSFRLF